MAVIEHYKNNGNAVFELHDDGERFGMFVDVKTAVSMEEAGLAHIIDNLGDTAMAGALAADTDY
jgi:hypothetical protein